MTVTFLRRVLAGGDLRVATTSNSLPDRLGEGRFSAEDFRREIAAIAEHFDVVRIDGPDVRATQTVLRETVEPAEVDRAVAGADPATVAVDDFDDLLAHLRDVHPVQYGPLVEAVETVVVRGLHPVTNQGDALLLVSLIDELYDADRTVLTTGAACPSSSTSPTATAATARSTAGPRAACPPCSAKPPPRSTDISALPSEPRRFGHFSAEPRLDGRSDRRVDVVPPEGVDRRRLPPNDPGSHPRPRANPNQMPRARRSTARSVRMSAPSVSVWETASMSTTSTSGGSSFSARRAWIPSLKTFALAKNSGPSSRATTALGSTTTSV